MQKKILIADDEEIMGKNIAIGFKRGGFFVVEVSSLKEVKEKIKDQKFDVAVVDYKLDPENGIDVLNAIKKRDKACPVIIMTGYTSHLSQEKAKEKGAFGYIEKPFSFKEILKLVNSALSK